MRMKISRESYYGVVNTEDVPCEKIYCGCAYFIAMNYVLRGDIVKLQKRWTILCIWQMKVFLRT